MGSLVLVLETKDFIGKLLDIYQPIRYHIAKDNNFLVAYLFEDSNILGGEGKPTISPPTLKRFSRKCGGLDFSQPNGPPWSVTRIVLPFCPLISIIGYFHVIPFIFSIF
jgi:hypothetical protein